VAEGGRVIIEGADLPYTLAPCCNPAPPASLVGYVTRGKGVTIHALGCRNVPVEPERYITCRWEQSGPAPLLRYRWAIRAVNRVSLIPDVMQVLAEQQAILSGLQVEALDGLPGRGEVELKVGVEVEDPFVMARLITQLNRVAGVIKIQRIDLA
jgi:GTP pyrophosphokinase